MNAQPSACQISVGFGAGNIGDEFMARAFWDSLPANCRLEVPLFPQHAHQTDPYPSQHVYVGVEYEGNENAHTAPMPGLLVGDTPVNEEEGLHFPLEFIARRLRCFHERNQPVHALGVGVDLLKTRAALRIFHDSFLPVRTWTVRTERCRQALLVMGVNPDQVITGADWAWLYRPRADLSAWAAKYLRELSVEPGEPLIMVNAVNMVWRDRTGARRQTALALDQLAAHAQIVFFCNESRDGEYFDMAAAREIAGLMNKPSVTIPNRYYSPDETLGLMRHATLAIAARYHFALQAVLARGIPLLLSRGQKIAGLAADLGIETAGSVDAIDGSTLVRRALHAMRNANEIRRLLATRRGILEARARKNLLLVQRQGLFVSDSGTA